MCVITATELKQNLGKYIEVSKEEDIIVIRHIITLANELGLKCLALEIKTFPLSFHSWESTNTSIMSHILGKGMKTDESPG